MRATTSGSAGAEGDTSPLMPHTTRKRYAVVSCHVERPLEDEIWERFSALQERRPGGFPIAALMRPADPAAGEDEDGWLERAREAAARGPLGHHTHWTAPDHARPTDGATGERVLAEGRRLRELGLDPTLFCGGGWYTDADVAEACAELGYVDCTPRASRPAYLGSNEAWASLREPARHPTPLGPRARGDSDDALARRSRSRASPVASASRGYARLLPRHRPPDPPAARSADGAPAGACAPRETDGPDCGRRKTGGGRCQPWSSVAQTS